MLKNTSVFSYCPELQHSVQNTPYSYCLFKAPILNTQSALIGRLMHAWANNANNNRAAVLNYFLQYQVAN